MQVPVFCTDGAAPSFPAYRGRVEHVEDLLRLEVFAQDGLAQTDVLIG